MLLSCSRIFCETFGVTEKSLPFNLFQTKPWELQIDADESLIVPWANRTLHADKSYGRQPVQFEINQGQTDAEVKYMARGRGYTLFLASTEAVMMLAATAHTGEADQALNSLPATAIPLPTARTLPQESLLRMRLAGANQEASLRAEHLLSGKVNYFIGNDPALWRTNIATFARVRYEEVYPGIDLIYYGNEGQLEYDFIVAPGADPNRITLESKERITSRLAEAATSSRTWVISNCSGASRWFTRRLREDGAKLSAVIC